jgi:hypothetical protein
MIAPRTPNRVWTDAFGSAICTLEGGYGGRVAAVVVGLEAGHDLAALALERLLMLPTFKGRVGLAVLGSLHAAPIAHAIRQLEAKVVISLQAAPGIVARGQKLNLEPGTFTSVTGLEYAESGVYDAWDAGWLAPRLEGTLERASVTASTAFSLGLSSVACGLDDLERTVLMALS